MPDYDLTPTATPRAAGAELDADTHGMVAVGAGAVTAIETVVGSIVLPAGGPWNIFGLWGQIARATQTPAEAMCAHVRLQASQGDIDPNPAPTRFPIPAFGSSLGAALGVDVCPLNIWPIRYVAPGKASIDLILSQDVASTVAPQAALGILFGKTIPERRPFVFMDRVRTTIAGAADTSVGTITLAEKATRITWIGAVLAQTGVITTAEELIGFFRLDSDDVKMAPAQFPISAAFGAGLGTTITNNTPIIPAMIPVNIPVEGGARINCFLDLNTLVTNAANIAVYIAYE
jgi:hypothetical protein